MKKLLNFKHVSYDSMIIIYYCFNNKDNYLIEFSDKTQEMTSFLIQNGLKITVPHFLISEIKRKDAMIMIETYISTKQIANLPKNINFTFKLGLSFKFKSKLEKLLKKEWFNVEDYMPSDEVYLPIEAFFQNLIMHPEYKEFLKKKNRMTPIPSFEDVGLMAFSKEKGCPIVSNDNDLTFFADELYEKSLTNKIFNFNDLDIYNN